MSLFSEPILHQKLQRRVLDHDNFGSALANSLAKVFAGDMEREQLYSLFVEVMRKSYHDGDMTVSEACLTDLTVIKARDPACEGLLHAFLNYKGFKALASHRIAHVLWNEGRRHLALTVQSLCSDIFAVDIHPAARIGTGNSYSLPSLRHLSRTYD